MAARGVQDNTGSMKGSSPSFLVPLIKFLQIGFLYKKSFNEECRDRKKEGGKEERKKIKMEKVAATLLPQDLLSAFRLQHPHSCQFFSQCLLTPALLGQCNLI